MPLTIPDDELRVRAVRAGGPGGQHVNKTSTKIEVMWDIAATTLLTDEEKQRVRERLGRRVDARGTLRVVSAGTRSQTRNRELAVARLHSLVREALVRPKPRRKRSPSPAAHRARLEAKKRQSEKKARRRPVDED